MKFSITLIALVAANMALASPIPSPQFHNGAWSGPEYKTGAWSSWAEWNKYRDTGEPKKELFAQMNSEKDPEYSNWVEWNAIRKHNANPANWKRDFGTWEEWNKEHAELLREEEEEGSYRGSPSDDDISKRGHGPMLSADPEMDAALLAVGEQPGNDNIKRDDFISWEKWNKMHAKLHQIEDKELIPQKERKEGHISKRQMKSANNQNVHEPDEWQDWHIEQGKEMEREMNKKIANGWEPSTWKREAKVVTDEDAEYWDSTGGDQCYGIPEAISNGFGHRLKACFY